jgi:hypothetical protein
MPDPPHCPRCNKAVEDTWHICPYCEAVLKGHARGSRGGAAHDLLEWAENRVDRPWVRDVAGIGGCIVVCGGLFAAPLVGRAKLGAGGVIFGILFVASGLALLGAFFGLTPDTYEGRILKVCILIVLFLVASLALLAIAVGIVVMLTMR